MLIGHRYMRENVSFSKMVKEVMQEYPTWSGMEVFNYVNRTTVMGQMRDSLQVQPGVTVMHQGVAGRLTPSMEGTPGTMSKSNPTNAIALNGGDQPSFQKLGATNHS